MRLDGVVKIDEAAQLKFPVGAVFEFNLIVPHVHQGTDHSLGLTIGLGSVHLGEFLADAMALAGHDKSMAVSALIFLAVVGIGVIDLVRALGENCVDEEMGGAVLGLVGQNVGVKLSGKIVDSNKEVFPGLCRRLPLKQRQTFRVEMDEFPGIGFIVALSLALHFGICGVQPGK